MGDLKLTSASGSVTLSPENVAGTTTITVPSSTATLLTTDGDGSSLTGYEGTAVASTGEAGGTKFLREDGDGTCSWQTAGSTSATDLTSGTLPTGRLPTGSILQVVRIDSGTQVTATNSAYVDVFSSDLSITAKETGSKFHILVYLAGLSWPSVTAGGAFRVVGAGETLHLQTHFAYGFGGGGGAVDNHRLAASYNTVTAGTATQGTTYAFNVEFKNSNSSYTIKVNNSGGHSSLVVMEVAG